MTKYDEKIFINKEHMGQVMRKHVLCHPRSLISTFVVRCLDSMICILAISKVSRLLLASVAEHAGWNLAWSKIPEDTFLRDVAHMKKRFEFNYPPLLVFNFYMFFQIFDAYLTTIQYY